MVGRLRLRVLGGKKLPAGDKEGTSDPYVIAKVSADGKQTQLRTRTVMRTLNPEWNQAFDVPCENLERIEFLVMDYDLASKDDELGTVTVTAKSHRLSRWPVVHELALPYGGLIRVEISISYNGIDTLFKKYSGQLALWIWEGKKLTKAKSPQCRIQFAGMTKHTATLKNVGDCPEWKEKIEFPEVKDIENDAPEHQIFITVSNKGLMETQVGMVSIPMSLLFSNPNSWWTIYKGRRINSNAERGQIRVKAEWNGTGGYPKAMPIPKGCQVGLEKASYGIDERMLDVTSVCRLNERKGILKIPPMVDFNFLFACDPCPGLRKSLVLSYLNEGEVERTTVFEGDAEETIVPVGDCQRWVEKKKKAEHKEFVDKNKTKIEEAKKRVRLAIQAAQKRAEARKAELDLERKNVESIIKAMYSIRFSMSEADRKQGIDATMALEHALEDKYLLAQKHLREEVSTEIRVFEQRWKSKFDDPTFRRIATV